MVTGKFKLVRGLLGIKIYVEHLETVGNDPSDPLLFHGWHKATSIQEQEILEKINAHKFPVDKYYEEYTKRK